MKPIGRLVSIVLATAFAIEVVGLLALEIQGALVSQREDPSPFSTLSDDPKYSLRPGQ